jgi:hypothetical protein
VPKSSNKPGIFSSELKSITLSKPKRAFIWPIFWTLCSVLGLYALIHFNPTAREVIGGAALSTFQVITSPFILESSLVLIGICVVLALSQWRQDEDAKDEWVYLETLSKETTETPPSDLTVEPPSSKASPPL